MYKLLSTAIHHPIRRISRLQSSLKRSVRSFSNDGKTGIDAKSQNKNNGVETTEEYLCSLGYDDIDVQNGMKDALRAAFGNDIKVNHLKSLGKDG